MPETATCTPGQGGSEAVAPGPVILRPANGNFPPNGEWVRLISNVNPAASAGMGIRNWDENSIVASLPERNPGTGKPGEEFTVKAKSGDTIYEAAPVRVIGPPGSGYPPTHIL